jgi:2'-hydroxyisoflavone reductase
VTGSLLVLGGTSFVGRAVVEAALAAGTAVTTLNRGISGTDVPGASALHADRDDAASLSVLSGRTFDAVIDVHGMTARQVSATAGRLADATPVYTLVSSVSVYAEKAFTGPGPVDESAAVTPADPDDTSLPDMARYGEQKRGAELAALRALGPQRTLIVRPGVILGPHENVHRVPYWLGRVAEGGEVLAPGHPDRSFEAVDVRDLAEWSVRSSLAVQPTTGVFNAVNPPGRDTWGDWLSLCAEVTGSDATFTWVDDRRLLAVGVAPWSGLPMWLPEDAAAVDSASITAAGFTFRPLRDTVAACWEWLRASGDSLPRPGYRPPPISRARERALLRGLR